MYVSERTLILKIANRGRQSGEVSIRQGLSSQNHWQGPSKYRGACLGGRVALARDLCLQSLSGAFEKWGGFEKCGGALKNGGEPF